MSEPSPPPFEAVDWAEACRFNDIHGTPEEVQRRPDRAARDTVDLAMLLYRHRQAPLPTEPRS